MKTANMIIAHISALHVSQICWRTTVAHLVTEDMGLGGSKRERAVFDSADG
jgi:hypothetical protein